jgi:nucleotide-binding universal stress UspA family protein
MYERILIATDGTALSKKAVTAGIALAAALDAELVACAVSPLYPHTYFEGASALTMVDAQRIEDQWREDTQRILDAVQKEAHRHDVKTTTVVVQGAVAENLIKVAKKQKCDLIVMASHGRKGIKRLLLGSETLDVLTHSHIPVLVLR